mmetsp:Transcript_10260/g.22197  ORF Transcript_10260/g.22197 Transcript_10260/m.22197 type:complete len:167 (+) Transcript_10260:591-1091(+)
MHSNEEDPFEEYTDQGEHVDGVSHRNDGGERSLFEPHVNVLDEEEEIKEVVKGLHYLPPAMEVTRLPKCGRNVKANAGDGRHLDRGCAPENESKISTEIRKAAANDMTDDGEAVATTDIKLGVVRGGEMKVYHANSGKNLKSPNDEEETVEGRLFDALHVVGLGPC